MPVTTFLVFGRSVSFEEATAGEAGTPLIEPAGYTFIVWSIIYAGGIAYALVQARPRARFDPLFSRIGWWTASAFLSVSVWLVMARLGLLWMTVLCIAWMAASLFPVFQALSAERGPLPRSRYWLVTAPLSVFCGWVSVAVFANVAAALKESGMLIGTSEERWTIALVVTAGVLAALLVRASRGNWAYGLTVEWALTAIVVANLLSRGPFPAIAASAAGAGVVVLTALLYARSHHGNARDGNRGALRGAAG